MKDQDFQKTMIGFACVIVVLLAFGIGVLLTRHDSAPPPPAQVPAAPTPTEAAAPTPAVPPAALRQAVVPPSPPAATPAVVQHWNPMERDCKVEQIGTQFRIIGTSNANSWSTNSVITSEDFPEGNFIVSADLKVPQLSGLVYIRASSSTGGPFGIGFDNNGYKLMQGSRTAKNVRPFGDEATTFHRLKMQYDAATHTTTGWVDDRPLGSITGPALGRLKFDLSTATTKAGTSVDVVFDHFSLLLSAADEPLTPAPGPKDMP